MFTFLSTLPVKLSKQIGKLFFQMRPQVYFVPGETERRKKVFLERKSIGLSYELSLTCARNVNYYKGVHHHIPTRVNRKHPGNFQNKSGTSVF